MNIVLFTSDLAASSRVAGVANAGGGQARCTANEAQLHQLAPGCDLVVVDLGTAGSKAPELLSKLRALDPAPRRIIAFGPHVHEDAFAAARDAGCDEVFTRGQFFARMNELLADS